MVRTGSELNDMINRSGAKYAELCVKMKRDLSQVEMNLFLKEMGGRLAPAEALHYE